MWSCHAKFVLFLEGDFDILLTTSANLNQNKRVENYLCVAEHPGGPVVADYLRLVEGCFCSRHPRMGLPNQSKDARIPPCFLHPQQRRDKADLAGVGQGTQTTKKWLSDRVHVHNLRNHWSKSFHGDRSTRPALSMPASRWPTFWRGTGCTARARCCGPTERPPTLPFACDPSRWPPRH